MNRTTSTLIAGIFTILLYGCTATNIDKQYKGATKGMSEAESNTPEKPRVSKVEFSKKRRHIRLCLHLKLRFGHDP